MTRMMATSTLDTSVSVYQVLRADPPAGSRLGRVGLTPELYDHRLSDAACEAHLPMATVLRAIRGS